jgi:vancomycin resistance protein YoaR
VGRSLDVARVAETLRGHIARLEKAAVILPFVETAPLVLDATPQAEAARRLLSQPLTLFVAEAAEGEPGPWTVAPDELATMLRITRVQDGAGSARFDVTLDYGALSSRLQPLTEPLQREAENARFIFNDETRQLDVMQPARDARALDVDATITAINAALLRGEHAVPLVFQVQPPAVSSAATAAELGITELVSEQFTSFAGSSQERVNNIKVAAARFHGLLIAPNTVFSFNENLGDVSLDSGFAEALIIYGGRTIRGIGGGVCQVSTTAFRTAYFAGFPIVERNPHAYRVGYYERGTAWQGPGLDAAIFSPLVDFKFLNDTPYWLLMETYVSEGNGRLTWKFYSTSDGRQVQVSAPAVTEVVPAPEPLYEENPELAAGEIKQVDFAADGADVTVTRIVSRDGARLNPDEPPLRTVYQPWRAIYEYGPGTEGIPTPTPTVDPSATPTP